MGLEGDELSMTADERSTALAILGSEYALLGSALGAAWSASLNRTTIFLGVLSAAGVAAGFAAQGGIESGSFVSVALVVLPVMFFLGVATFVRLVQVQRESIVYIAGMNRIRYFFQQIAPKTRPYFVLPAHDDGSALFRSPGTGMPLRPPRFQLLYLLVQTQGVVGVITAAVGGAFGALLVARVAPDLSWPLGVTLFVVAAAGLFVYWQRSLTELMRSIRSVNPTPADEIGAQF